MADAEISILIKAIDEMSATVKNIENTLTNSNTHIQQTATQTGQAFTEQMGSLILLGQAAQTVDNIWSSYQNMQIRVENATDRVANAEDRLREAQYKLSKVTQDGTSSAEDIANAQQNVESATRGLDIAQRNLERTQNAVVGTYINMSLQTATLLTQFPKLATALKTLTTLQWGWNAAMLANPIGLLIGLATALVAVTALEIKWLKDKYDANQQIIEQYKNYPTRPNLPIAFSAFF